jgi:hypothetical protein
MEGNNIKIEEKKDSDNEYEKVEHGDFFQSEISVEPSIMTSIWNYGSSFIKSSPGPDLKSIADHDLLKINNR